MNNIIKLFLNFNFEFKIFKLFDANKRNKHVHTVRVES